MFVIGGCGSNSGAAVTPGSDAPALADLALGDAAGQAGEDAKPSVETVTQDALVGSETLTQDVVSAGDEADDAASGVADAATEDAPAADSATGTDTLADDTEPADVMADVPSDIADDTAPPDVFDVAPDTAVACAQPLPVTLGLPPGNCTPEGWCKLAPGGDFTSLYGFGASDIWAARGNGLLRWNGQGWALVYGGLDDTEAVGAWPTKGPGKFFGVWGAGPGDVWFAGQDPQGALLHYDGAAFSRVPTNGKKQTWRAVWGAGPGDVWAGGDALARWDGCNWTVVKTDAGIVRGIWGSGPSAVWIAAEGGLFFWDGAAFSAASLPQDIGTSLQPWLVWGASKDDVWSVAYVEVNWVPTSVILHFDGTAWTKSQLLPNEVTGDSLARGLVGFGKDDVWTFGSGAWRAAHWDGASWQEVPVPDEALSDGPRLATAWGALPGGFWAGGLDGALLYWNGAAFEREARGSKGLDFTGMWGTSADDLWLTGQAADKTRRIWHWDGTLLDEVGVIDPPPGPLSSLTGVGGSNLWYGDYGSVRHWDGVSWTVEKVPSSGEPGPVAVGLYQVWADTADSVWAAGDGGRLYRGTGSPMVWKYVPNTLESHIAGIGYAGIWAMRGLPGGTIWLGGTGWDKAGKKHWGITKGSSETGTFEDIQVPLESGYLYDVTAVFPRTETEAWFGAGPKVLRYLDGVYTELPIPDQGHTVWAIWAAAANDVWAASANINGGTNLNRWDGTAFQVVGWLGTSYSGMYSTMLGFGAQDVFFSAKEGGFYHFKGLPTVPAP